jgi:predicted transposase YbfD/YdcC
MDGPVTSSLLRFFLDVPDPRAGNISHLLTDIVSLAVLATLCGAQGWTDVEFWAQNHAEWLGTFLSLRAGIPSHDTFSHVFAAIDPDAFERCFMTWTRSLVESSAQRPVSQQFVAIDGKTLRMSFEHAWSRTPIHMVSAFVADNQLILGQVKVDCKANETVAIPKLIDLLNLKGATVTIDAMGCQKEIARKLREEKKAHYVLALKDNQPSLHAAVIKTFTEAQAEKFVGWTHDYTEEVDAGHGRIETRKLWVTTNVKHIAEARQWTGLASIVMAESTRDVAGKGKTTEVRYFICSYKKPDAKRAARAIRDHWGIENSQHHVLDATMNEDACRIRMGHGAQNFARLRRVALNQLRKVTVRNARGTDMKASIRAKLKLCGWNRNFLLSALLA